MIVQTYVQIVLARCIGKNGIGGKSFVGSDDLIYRTVSYISGNFRRQFFFGRYGTRSWSEQVCISKVFSKTFHRNFNQYLNDARLSYACTRLVNTSDTILNICLDSGLTVREHLTECLKNAIKPHQVNIGKTKDEMGKGLSS